MYFFIFIDVKQVKGEEYEKRKTPIVFVPGLFGSMNNIIIPGTGDWSFGLSAFVYEPFILMLESMGYERNKTYLFVL